MKYLLFSHILSHRHWRSRSWYLLWADNNLLHTHRKAGMSSNLLWRSAVSVSAQPLWKKGVLSFPSVPSAAAPTMSVTVTVLKILPGTHPTAVLCLYSLPPPHIFWMVTADTPAPFFWLSGLKTEYYRKIQSPAPTVSSCHPTQHWLLRLLHNRGNRCEETEHFPAESSVPPQNGTFFVPSGSYRFHGLPPITYWDFAVDRVLLPLPAEWSASDFRPLRSNQKSILPMCFLLFQPYREPVCRYIFVSCLPVPEDSVCCLHSFAVVPWHPLCMRWIFLCLPFHLHEVW